MNLADGVNHLAEMVNHSAEMELCLIPKVTLRSFKLMNQQDKFENMDLNSYPAVGKEHKGGIGTMINMEWE